MNEELNFDDINIEDEEDNKLDNLVFENNGAVVVSSREVAINFNKRHTHIIEKISNLILEFQPTEKSARYFMPHEYKDNKGEMRKEYLLTRDGFTLTVMGFTGQKALEWKLKYIDAFNKMEEYIKSQNKFKLPQTYSDALRQLADKVDENDKLKSDNKQKEEAIKVLAPKADYTDTVLKSNSLATTSQIAKDYGMSAVAFNQLLNSYGIQYKKSNQWFLYAKYQNKGYTKSITVPYTHTDGSVGSALHTKWTEIGRKFLYEFLKGKGILPVVTNQQP